LRVTHKWLKDKGYPPVGKEYAHWNETHPAEEIGKIKQKNNNKNRLNADAITPDSPVQPNERQRE
jgi:hypothetical protein